MWKLVRIVVLAACVAAILVPVGFALSLESEPPAVLVRHTTAAAATVQRPMPVRTSDAVSVTIFHSVPDAAKLLVLGTLLFGVAAAVRKAV